MAEQPEQEQPAAEVATSRWKRARHSVWHHLREEWRAALFVSACVAIVHSGFGWLEALEGYAFLTVGNLASRGTVTAPEHPKAVVVRIDQASYEARYHDRSPLYRCALRDDLAAIYAAKPDLVVIDLDLSRSVWMEHAKAQHEIPTESGCEDQLYEVIRRSAAAPPNVKPINTVLIDPFPPAVRGGDLETSKLRWQAYMVKGSDGHIEFANASLPISYGLTNDYFAGGRSLYTVARAQAGLPLEHAQWSDRFRKDKIDPRTYRKDLGLLLTSWVSGAELTPALEHMLVAPDSSQPQRPRVVFFGAGYGQDDVFLTALGEFYGVEIHAAAFLSHSNSSLIRDILASIADFFLGILFGVLIAWFWKRYFSWHVSETKGYAQAAGIWILWLAVALLSALGLLLWASWVILSHWGIWLSPIPMAIGMLIDGCVSGSVSQANQQLKDLRRGTPAPILEPRSPKRLKWLAISLRGVSVVVWVIAVSASFVLLFAH